MDSTVRKPFQGILNIVRFNWHFYVLAISVAGILSAFTAILPEEYHWGIGIAAFLVLFSAFLSLLVSFYIYDYSGFYSFDWLNQLNIQRNSTMVNIHAGFDETSDILEGRFPSADLKILDFYDPEKHTEVSIERARKAYVNSNRNQQISTAHVPLENDSVDFIFSVFAAHEIRSRRERINFFKQLKSSLKSKGRCVVVEHLRDVPNFLAYNIGFLHFFSKASWISDFANAGLTVQQEIKKTPFVSIFILNKKNGDTL